MQILWCIFRSLTKRAYSRIAVHKIVSLGVLWSQIPFDSKASIIHKEISALFNDFATEHNKASTEQNDSTRIKMTKHSIK